MQENPSKAAAESKTHGNGQDDASHATGRTPACGVSDATGRTPACGVSPTVATILEHNAAFVASKGYERYQTDKYPEKKLAIVSCMDTRLTELLLAALGLKNGDAKII